MMRTELSPSAFFHAYGLLFASTRKPGSVSARTIALRDAQAKRIFQLIARELGEMPANKMHHL